MEWINKIFNRKIHFSVSIIGDNTVIQDVQCRVLPRVDDVLMLFIDGDWFTTSFIVKKIEIICWKDFEVFRVIVEKVVK